MNKVRGTLTATEGKLINHEEETQCERIWIEAKTMTMEKVVGRRRGSGQESVLPLGSVRERNILGTKDGVL